MPHGVVPPPVAYVAVLVVTAIVHVFAPTRVLPAGSLQFGVGLPVIALGLAILAWAFTALRRVGEHSDPGRPTEAIMTTGPYTFTRNPIYVAFTVVALGVSLAVNSAWMMAGVPVALATVWWGTVRREERYLAYKRSVPRWFLFI